MHAIADQLLRFWWRWPIVSLGSFSTFKRDFLVRVSFKMSKRPAPADLNKNMPKKMIIQQTFCEDYTEKDPCFMKSSVGVHDITWLLQYFCDWMCGCAFDRNMCITLKIQILHSNLYFITLTSCGGLAALQCVGVGVWCVCYIRLESFLVPMHRKGNSGCLPPTMPHPPPCVCECEVLYESSLVLIIIITNIYIFMERPHLPP